jgi:PAS domain S-box-containing protein
MTDPAVEVDQSAVRSSRWRPRRRAHWALRPTRRSLGVRLEDEAATASFAAASDPQLCLDRRGQIALANPAAVRLFGPHVTSRPVGELLDHVPGEHENPAPVVTTARRTDGAEVEVRVRRTPITGTAHLRALLTVHDLAHDRAAEAAHRSQRHEIHALRGQVSAVLAALTDHAVLLVDPQGYLTEVNRAAEKMLGRRAAELVGRPLSGLSHREHLDAVRAELGLTGDADPLLELARAGLPNRQEWTLAGSEGRQAAVTLSITTMPIADTGAPGFVVVATSRSAGWEPMMVRPRGERLLLDLDDAETRALRWQVGGSTPRRR